MTCGSSLVMILDLRRGLDGIPRRRRTTLIRAVVHDCNPGRNGSKKSRTVALQPATMRDDENIDRAQFVSRAQKLEFLIPRQIAKIENLNLAEGNDRAERAGVFRLVGPAFS
jgi:hypothetical protein